MIMLQVCISEALGRTSVVISTFVRYIAVFVSPHRYSLVTTQGHFLSDAFQFIMRYSKLPPETMQSEIFKSIFKGIINK